MENLERINNKKSTTAHWSFYIRYHKMLGSANKINLVNLV
jgi:hypothetical protein